VWVVCVLMEVVFMMIQLLVREMVWEALV
jgi:hypothetical protein